MNFITSYDGQGTGAREATVTVNVCIFIFILPLPVANSDNDKQGTRDVSSPCFIYLLPSPGTATTTITITGMNTRAGTQTPLIGGSRRICVLSHSIRLWNYNNDEPPYTQIPLMGLETHVSRVMELHQNANP